MIAYNKLTQKRAKDYFYFKSIVHQTSKNPMRTRINLSNKYLGEIVFSWSITPSRVVGHYFLRNRLLYMKERETRAAPREQKGPSLFERL